MNLILQPWHLMLVVLAGWINRQQQQLIEFQDAQIKILLERQGRKRLLLTDEQRLTS